MFLSSPHAWCEPHLLYSVVLHEPNCTVLVGDGLQHISLQTRNILEAFSDSALLIPAVLFLPDYELFLKIKK